MTEKSDRFLSSPGQPSLNIALSMRQVNILRGPIKPEELVLVESWKNFLDEIVQSLTGDPSGVVVIHDPPGSGGGSVFLRYLCSQLSRLEKIHVLRGVIAEPIHTPGWLLGFIAQTLSGGVGRIHPREVLAKVSDLSSRVGSLAIVVDGLNLVSVDVLAGDLAAYCRLFGEAGIPCLLITNLDSVQSEQLKRHPVFSGLNIMTIPLPTLSSEEIRSVLEKKLVSAALEPSRFKVEIERAVQYSSGYLGAAIESITQQEISGGKIAESPFLGDSLREVGSRAAIKPRPVRKGSPKTSSSFEDLLGPRSQPKPKD